jgi:hypothetical protein
MTSPGGGKELHVSRDELSATVAARHELGHEYESALVDSLADRVEQVVQARVQAHMAHQPPSAPPASSLTATHRMVLAAVSLGTAIPLTAIAAGMTGVAGVAIVWGGIAVVNVAAAMGPRRWR